MVFLAGRLESKNNEEFLLLHRVLLRPHVEYSVQVWQLHLKRDMLALETVKRRFTRLLPGVRELSCDEILWSLEEQEVISLNLHSSG